MTLLEAAACGKPLVATDMPGCREIVRPGENGFLVIPGDVNDLADALCRLIVNRDLRDSFGRNSRLMVEREFSDKKVISDTFAVYRELLGELWPSPEKS